jgi:hypothetical protein
VAGDNVINLAEQQGATIAGSAEADAKIELAIGGAVRTVQADAQGAHRCDTD